MPMFEVETIRMGTSYFALLVCERKVIKLTVVVLCRSRNAAKGEREFNAFFGQRRQSSPGMMRRMNWSNRGTVKAVSPWPGLHTIPFEIS